MTVRAADTDLERHTDLILSHRPDLTREQARAAAQAERAEQLREEKPADRYRVANEASDGATVTFLRIPREAIGWTPDLFDADAFDQLEHARAVLAAIEATRDRAGRRFVVAEIDTPDGPAHREVTEAEAEALRISEAHASMSADANIYFERYPEAEK